jgi:hypothetical protein
MTIEQMQRDVRVWADAQFGRPPPSIETKYEADGLVTVTVLVDGKIAATATGALRDIVGKLHGNAGFI